MVGGSVGTAAHPDNHALTRTARLSCVNYMIPNYRLKTFFSALARFGEINNNQAAVYQALVSYQGSQGCFPCHATLAAEAGVSERTVRNALREARYRGWIDWTNQRSGRRQTSNRYRFTIKSDYLNKILNAIRWYKRKTAEICMFFRRHNLPGSPYFYIKQAGKRLVDKIERPHSGLSPWQQLFQANPQAAIAQLYR